MLQAEPTDRHHALDAARAFALLLGIVLHATMSFFLPIPAQDVSSSTTLAVTFYVIHTFRMSLFFLLAGFLAHHVFHRRGLRAFLADRAKRIVVPMTVGWLVLAPPLLALVIWGQSRTFPTGPPPAAEGAALGFPLLHLWFLYYLCLLYALVLAAREAITRFVDPAGVWRARLDRWVAAGVNRFLAPVALAAPLFAVLVLDADWPVWFGIPTPETGLTPQVPALVGFGTAFGFGWLLHRQPNLLRRLEGRWLAYLMIAISLTAACLALVGTTPDLSAPTVLAGGMGRRIVYAAAYALSVWCWLFGLLGAAGRFFSAPSARWRYLADASYWVYLVHLPIVFALQVVVMRWPLPWAVKFPLVVGVASGVALASFHFLVRGRLLGELLNGRRTAPDPPASDPAVVAQLTGVSHRYGATVALDGLDLTMRAGQVLALLGPNGAGKTTAIGLLLGLLKPETGSVRLLGGSPFEVRHRLGIGVMLQEVSLAPMLTAREHLVLTTSYYRNPLTVDEAVALAGLEAIADRRYGKLSGGQKRQVQFALAVCGRPRLLFLDEPTVGLDVPARESLWRAIRALVAGGTAVVLTTHYLEEAEALADRVVVLAAGRCVADGSVAEVRGTVTRTVIRCVSTLVVDLLRRWPGVVAAERDGTLLLVTASDPDAVVRRLLLADPELHRLEVTPGSLAEVFSTLTAEAA
ncbi:MAG: acyltransferase family protein [Thermoanaerobaculia bacterium]|nr:acyltransferase family protein [Thermoanaerobaculia bacterium]